MLWKSARCPSLEPPSRRGRQSVMGGKGASVVVREQPQTRLPRARTTRMASDKGARESCWNWRKRRRGRKILARSWFRVCLLHKASCGARTLRIAKQKPAPTRPMQLSALHGLNAAASLASAARQPGEEQPRGGSRIPLTSIPATLPSPGRAAATLVFRGSHGDVPAGCNTRNGSRGMGRIDLGIDPSMAGASGRWPMAANFHAHAPSWPPSTTFRLPFPRKREGS